MKKICLTGATGFIGSNLMNLLAQDENNQIIALSRGISPAMDGAKKDNITWRRCNGFSLIDCEQATKDADVLIYLIHSMIPSTSLSQGSFLDFDLYLADNFARASRKNKVKKIIYLSGIVPQDKKLSDHLKSRLEVEHVLGQYGTPVISLRCGLIIGQKGSSFKILERLVNRLPILICPAWTLNRTQPVHLDDVLIGIKHCLEKVNEPTVYDFGGPNITTYRNLLKLTAKTLNKKRVFFNFPYFAPALSKLWVSVFSSSHKNLVYPLIESLKHEMLVDPSKQLVIEGHKFKNIEESLKQGLSNQKETWVRMIIDYNKNINLSWMKNVTSIQRINSIYKNDPNKLSNLYFSWLEKFLRPLIKIIIDGNCVRFRLFNLIDLLELRLEEKRSIEGRVFYYIVGGVLARKQTMNGRLEFRYIEHSQCYLVCLLDFCPSLPWFIYKYTQALAHLFVMRCFQKHNDNLLE